MSDDKSHLSTPRPRAERQITSSASPGYNKEQLHQKKKIPQGGKMGSQSVNRTALHPSGVA